MRLDPRYGAEPIVLLDHDDVAAATIRQRRRLAEALAGFDAGAWSHPSRCAGWSTRDVVTHLDVTNTFWIVSIEAGLADEPTRILDGFDPVASPAEHVSQAAGRTDAEHLERFTESTARLCDLLDTLGGSDWDALAEAPPGHATVSAVVHHALWDAWVHERDIHLPLGSSPVTDDDEIAASLRYAVALSAAMGVLTNPHRTGRVGVAVTDPDLEFTVEATDRVTVTTGGAAGGEAAVRGDAVELLEAVSRRRPFDHPVPGASAWMLHGLAAAFDQDP